MCSAPPRVRLPIATCSSAGAAAVNGGCAGGRPWSIGRSLRLVAAPGLRHVPRQLVVAEIAGAHESRRTPSRAGLQNPRLLHQLVVGGIGLAAEPRARRDLERYP